MSIELSTSIKKLSHELDSNNLVNYFFNVNDENASIAKINLNDLIGKTFKLEFTGLINCIACNRAIKKSFNNGYCYPCLTTLAECDICILKPSLCHYDKGTCRDNEFAKEHCNITHSLYLSLTSGAKIGITRQHQEVSRWIDQGAIKALRIMSVKRRYHVGLLEDKIAKIMPDKTNWRKMLQNQYEDLDLIELREKVLSFIEQEFKENKFTNDLDYIFDVKEDLQIQEIKYPVKEFPQKIKSFNLDSNPLLEGTLIGIKGQYLIFDTGVINFRKYAGYKVKLEVN